VKAWGIAGEKQMTETSRKSTAIDQQKSLRAVFSIRVVAPQNPLQFKSIRSSSSQFAGMQG